MCKSDVYVDLQLLWHLYTVASLGLASSCGVTRDRCNESFLFLLLDRIVCRPQTLISDKSGSNDFLQYIVSMSLKMHSIMAS